MPGTFATTDSPESRCCGSQVAVPRSGCSRLSRSLSESFRKTLLAGSSEKTAGVLRARDRHGREASGRRQQAEHAGPLDGPAAIVDIQLRVDVAQVSANGVRREAELGGDRSCTEVPGQVSHDA